MPPTASASATKPPYDRTATRAMTDGDDLSPMAAFKRAALGLLFVAAGFALVLCLLSYSPFDSTPDTAGIGSVQNVFGRSGANLANLMMQILGWGGLLTGTLFVFTGVRAIIGRTLITTKLERWSRIGLFFGIVLFGTATLSAFPIPQSWPMATGLGGWTGDVIYLSLKSILERINIPFAGVWVACVTFLLAAFCLARFVGVMGRDVMDVWDAAGLVWAVFRVGLDRVAFFLKTHLFDKIGAAYATEFSEGPAFVGLEGERDPAVKSSKNSAPPKAIKIKTAQLSKAFSALAPIPAPETQPQPAPAAKPKPKAKTPKAPAFNFPDGSDFVLPGLDLLKVPPPRNSVTDEGALRRSSENLHRVMAEYGIEGEMGDVRPGPVVTLFEFEPAPGVKSKRIIGLANDIARNMSAQSTRIAVVPGRNAMGVELPNRRRETVWLRDMLASTEYVQTEAALPLIMGEDIGGTPFIADLAKMPHLLVAGTTGSGKSVAVNAMILSLMYKLPPEQCKFIMIDPKMLELSIYDNAPHLLAPVVTEPKKAVVALKWAVREMEDRYRKMSKMGVRNMAGYNEKVAEALSSGEPMTRTVMTGYDKESGDPIFETEALNFELMPYIVVIIDEMADLMMVARKEIEGSVQRLAQMARAAGIHMIMATQRPSTDVITGTIKANFPTRVSFRVGSSIDSRTIINENGAEQLLGNGDMLFMGTGRPRRLHGPFVSDGEVERIAEFVKAQGAPSYLEDITSEREDSEGLPGEDDESGDEGSLFDQAVAIVARDRKASTSYIQRKLSIGYNRAANLVERMEDENMIGPSGPGGKREIFLPEKDGY